LTGRILKDWLIGHGYLKDDKPVGGHDGFGI
jgi:hypothetical protein